MDLRHGDTGSEGGTGEGVGVSGDGNRENDERDGPGDGIQTRDDEAARVQWVRRARLLAGDGLAAPGRLQVETDVQQAQYGLPTGRSASG